MTRQSSGHTAQYFLQVNRIFVVPAILHNTAISCALALDILKASHFSNTSANAVDEASFIILETSAGACLIGKRIMIKLLEISSHFRMKKQLPYRNVKYIKRTAMSFFIIQNSTQIFS